jgi:hypothetical protein
MTKLVWNQAGDRFYETGVDRGVLYPNPGVGVAWNGLVSVSQNVSGGEVDGLFLDGIKYLDHVANEDFQASLEAFSSPAQFDACDGSRSLVPGLVATQQRRKTFGLTYRTLMGNDLLHTEYGYKLHLVYNATAAPSARANQTLNDSPDPSIRQWNIHTVPDASAVTYKPTAHFEIDSTKIDSAKLALLEDALYGTVDADPYLPSQSEVITLLTPDPIV